MNPKRLAKQVKDEWTDLGREDDQFPHAAERVLVTEGLHTGRSAKLLIAQTQPMGVFVPFTEGPDELCVRILYSWRDLFIIEVTAAWSSSTEIREDFVGALQVIAGQAIRTCPAQAEVRAGNRDPQTEMLTPGRIIVRSAGKAPCKITPTECPYLTVVIRKRFAPRSS